MNPILKFAALYLGLSKLGKLGVAALMAITVQSVLQLIGAFFNTYVFSDWKVVPFILVAVTIDTLLGAYRAWQSKSLSSRGLGKAWSKIVAYGCLLIVGHGLSSFGGADMTYFDWFPQWIYAFILVREALSIFEHFAHLGIITLPPAIISRLQQFGDDGQSLPSSPPTQQ
jgi:phage-related holin